MFCSKSTAATAAAAEVGSFQWRCLAASPGVCGVVGSIRELSLRSSAGGAGDLPTFGSMAPRWEHAPPTFSAVK